MKKKLIINDHIFDWGARTYIMGVLNLTPDSFSGDGLLAPDVLSDELHPDLDIVLKKAKHLVENGVDIIDVGGESTRPGAKLVSAEEEMERVIPAIRLLASEINAILSIDTYKASVAEEAIQQGARIVNDVWGLHADPNLASVVEKYQTPVILMHNRSSWAHAEIKEKLGGRYVGIPYENLLEDVKRELMESVVIARTAGISDDSIILDPGIGFGKSVDQNLELLDRLDEIKQLGFPVLLGPSRKSFIGYTLNLPPDQRMEGTAAAVSIGIDRGADIIRVHDFPSMTRVIRMADAIIRRRTCV
jgi:dihydropteroate synthase